MMSLSSRKSCAICHLRICCTTWRHRASSYRRQIYMCMYVLGTSMSSVRACRKVQNSVRIHDIHKHCGRCICICVCVYSTRIHDPTFTCRRFVTLLHTGAPRTYSGTLPVSIIIFSLSSFSCLYIERIECASESSSSCHVLVFRRGTQTRISQGPPYVCIHLVQFFFYFS